MSATDDLGLDPGRYKVGWNNEADGVFKPKQGIDENIIREMSWMKGEPDWMLDVRLASFDGFEQLAMPHWGGDTSAIDFDDICTYPKPTKAQRHDWDAESEAVYRRNRDDLAARGVIFCDMDTALREYPQLVKQYFGTVIAPDDNKFSALNSSVWSGGSFLYVPEGVDLSHLPLQAYFRGNDESMGQFERTLIVADKGSKVHYIEGCSAPVYSADSLHSAVVEIVVKESARVTHTTMQNWSSNVFNLVTKRAVVEAEGHMAWIDGTIGSRLTMMYPGVVMVGPKASGEVLSVAYAGAGQHQDTGAKMVHIAPETTSKIVSKSITKDGGRTSCRGLVRVEDGADGCRSHMQSDALVLDDESISDTYPHKEVGSHAAVIGHEATVARIADEQRFYLMSRGLTEEQALAMIVNGFIEPITVSLPMEYAVEWSRLIELQMEGSVG